MSTTNITGIEFGPIIVNSANDTYNIKAGATLLVGPGSGEISAAIVENIENPSVNHDNTYNIDGLVIGGLVGVYTVGARDKINIGETGQVEGTYGIAFVGKNTKVVNDGEITAGLDGFAIYGMGTAGSEIRNNGLASGNIGIAYAGMGGSIINGEDGVIVGNTAGVTISLESMSAAAQMKGAGKGFEAAGGPVTEFINHGKVIVANGGEAAFAANGVNVSLVNDGMIKGVVALGDGDSVFDNRGGTVTSSIIGGGGDDVLIVDDGKYKLVEEAMGGADTVKSTVNYKLSANVENLMLLGNANIDGTGSGGANTIRGNIGNNTLNGQAGADHLFGGKGNDKLLGGADADTFHFSTGDGKDKVMDMVQGADKIDVSGWDAIGNFAQLKAHAADQGADVLITDGSDSLLIVGLHKADLKAVDFDFTA
jgi:Ca2+-binding RTX toxin-like protein